MHKPSKFLTYFLVLLLALVPLLGTGNFALAEDNVENPVKLALVGQPTVENNRVGLTVKTTNTGEAVESAIYHLTVEGDLTEEKITVDYGQGKFDLLKTEDGKYEGTFGPAEGFTLGTDFEAETDFTADLAPASVHRTVVIKAWLAKVADGEKIAELNPITIELPAELGLTEVAAPEIFNPNDSSEEVFKLELSSNYPVTFNYIITDKDDEVISSGETTEEADSLIVVWDGKTEDGKMAASGYYSLNLTAVDAEGNEAGYSHQFGLVALADIEKSWAKDTIEKMVLKGIITGRDEQTFAPTEQITREDFAILTARMLDLTPTPGYVTKLSDLDGEDIYGKQYILALEEAGIINGYLQADGSYKYNPKQNITRGECATLFALILGLDKADANVDTELTDLKNHWAEGYVKALEKVGVMTGYPDKSFKPDNNITREEAAFLTSRIEGKEINI